MGKASGFSLNRPLVIHSMRSFLLWAIQLVDSVKAGDIPDSHLPSKLKSTDSNKWTRKKYRNFHVAPKKPLCVFRESGTCLHCWRHKRIAFTVQVSMHTCCEERTPYKLHNAQLLTMSIVFHYSSPYKSQLIKRRMKIILNYSTFFYQRIQTAL